MKLLREVHCTWTQVNLRILSFVLAQIEDSIAKKNQNTTTLEEPAQTEGRSRNNVHMRPNFSRDLSITPGYNETFDPPSRIKVCKIILVGNIRSLFQICKSPLPLSPSMTLQVVANDLSCFLNGPLQLIKHQYI